MARHLVESLSGFGAIYAGEVWLRNVAYELSLWSDEPPGPDAGGRDFSPAGPVTSIDGHINLTGMGEAVVLAGPDTLTLELQDGRRLTFKLLNTGGAIQGVGVIQEK